MENNNKKTLVLSIIGILVLVIAVVGVSFAMFSFSGTGTKENVIKTGKITVEFDNASNHIAVSNEYPMTDAAATARNDNTTTFKVQGDWGSLPMTVNYELGLSDIHAGSNLTDEFVKVAISKDTTTFVKGSATGGETIQSFASDHGTLAGTTIQNYFVTSGTLQNETSGTANMDDQYVVRAWVSSDYNLPENTITSTTDNSGNATVAQDGGSALHKKATNAETYSFKVKVFALQA